jgi:hypothetical protein
MEAMQAQLEIPNAIAYHVPHEDDLGTGCLVAQEQRHPNSTRETSIRLDHYL